ncbi:hypothetical protein HPB51_027502 [Rhipicephalus microplus]|uniref:Uncharacterized protein n=1 Tax=Rhipicephalus microplus TaxID=6941 RepID=A0A9J6CZX1_RHIMP|nr:hypothetical protein HPB51_027502 [Rhipicephalus microplus]
MRARERLSTSLFSTGQIRRERNIEQMTRYLASKKSRRQILSLFKAHIEHFGVLNFTVDSEDYAHDKKIGKRLFQLLSKLQRHWPPRVKATSDGRQRALGLRFRSYADDSELARHTEVMKDLCRSIDITIFVALTHTDTATIWSSWLYKGERINAATLHCKQDYVRELAAPGKIRIASYKNYSVSFEDSEIMKQKVPI